MCECVFGKSKCTELQCSPAFFSNVHVLLQAKSTMCVLDGSTIHAQCMFQSKSGGLGRAVQAVRRNAACKRVTRLIASGRWCTKACVCVSACALTIHHTHSVPTSSSLPPSRSFGSPESVSSPTASIRPSQSGAHHQTASNVRP